MGYEPWPFLPQWLAGDGPPSFQELGPYTYRIDEKHINVEFSDDWASTSYTYYQWQTFEPSMSCSGCDPLTDRITGVNRGYQQLLASAAGSSMDAETMLIYSMLPSVLFQVRLSIYAAVEPMIEAQMASEGITDPGTIAAAVDAAVTSQWASCGALAPLVGLGISSPYLADLSPLFPAPPEFCAYVPVAMAPALGFTPTPSQFASLGVDIDANAATMFLSLAIGNTTSTVMDSSAAAFISSFLTLPRTTLLAQLSATPTTAAAASALTAITDLQWMLLQGYLANLVPVWGKLVYQGFLASFGEGGAGLIIERTVDVWLNGMTILERDCVCYCTGIYISHISTNLRTDPVCSL